jgi:peroxiredoxin family protein
VTPATPLAAVLATGEPERLYSGLSVLVSSAVDGRRCTALASFRALEQLLAPQPSGHGERFDRSLAELIATAHDLDSLSLYACSASVDLLEIEGEPLDGVMSTPRFLRDASDAELIFV